MCTVTFIPVKDRLYITSNRDERGVRQKALAPVVHNFHNCSLLYPKDAQAGGTWIAVKNDGDVAVLLNGAFIGHVPRPPYRESRGLIIVKVLTGDDSYEAFRRHDFTGIEPFTLVLFAKKKLFECRWNAEEKFIKQLDAREPHIWSSATLYPANVIQKRKGWFEAWLENNPTPVQKDVVDFHRFGGDGDSSNDLFMNRNNEVLTVSITSIAITGGRAKMIYLDAVENTEHHTDFVITNKLEAYRQHD